MSQKFTNDVLVRTAFQTEHFAYVTLPLTRREAVSVEASQGATEDHTAPPTHSADHHGGRGEDRSERAVRHVQHCSGGTSNGGAGQHTPVLRQRKVTSDKSVAEGDMLRGSACYWPQH